MKEFPIDQAAPVSFGEKLAGSQAFANLFRDGMALVEETAAYLDGPGRQESKKLERSAALAYATESMRLTTQFDSFELFDAYFWNVYIETNMIRQSFFEYFFNHSLCHMLSQRKICI